MDTLSSSVGAKFQVTLPKKVRAVLGIRKAGERVGFRVEGGRVVLAKAAIQFEDDPFTEVEWAKMLQLAQQAPRKTYSAKELLARHRRLTRG